MANVSAVREKYRVRAETIKTFRGLWQDYKEGKLSQAEYLAKVAEVQKEIDQRVAAQQSLPLATVQKEIVHN